MKQYLDLVADVIDNGSTKDDRTGTGTIQLFGKTLTYDLLKGFPIMTTKYVNFTNIVVETLWYINGGSNIKYLVDNGCNVWNDDAYRYYTEQVALICNEYIAPRHMMLVKDENQTDMLRQLTKKEFIAAVSKFTEYDFAAMREQCYGYAFGDLGNVYGKIWRDAHGVDQISKLIQDLSDNPYGRRHIVSAWLPDLIKGSALPPCHVLTQWNVDKVDGDYYLDCLLYIRSNDMALGHPYNVSTYALIMHIIAATIDNSLSGIKPRNLVINIGDCHVYSNHIDNLQLQLTREPKALPKLSMSVAKTVINNIVTTQVSPYDFTKLTPSDFGLIAYEYEPSIKFDLSVGKFTENPLFEKR